MQPPKNESRQKKPTNQKKSTCQKPKKPQTTNRASKNAYRFWLKINTRLERKSKENPKRKRVFNDLVTDIPMITSDRIRDQKRW
jgi:hypothetical protein